MRSNLVRLLGAVILLMAIVGCSSMPKTQDGAELKPNEGLLALHVSSNADAYLSYLDFSPESTFGSRFGEYMAGPKGRIPIRAGETYYVLPLPAGEYMWSRFDAHPKFAWLQGTNRFKVNAKGITYIGHIHVNVVDSRFTLQARDREVEMRTHLLENYPAYFRSMGVQKAIAELRLR